MPVAYAAEAAEGLPAGGLEPNVAWTTGLLVLRCDWYEATPDPLLPAAVADLVAYASQQPAPLTIQAR